MQFFDGSASQIISKKCAGFGKTFLLYHLSMDIMIISHDVSDGDISLVGNCDIIQL